MNIEEIEQYSIILGGAVAGFIVFIKKFKKSPIKKIKIEDKIDKMEEELKTIIKEETKKASEIHIKIFDKMEKLGNDLSFIRGKMSKS